MLLLLVVYGSIRKWAEQSMMSNPVSNTPPLPLHHFMPTGSCPLWVSVLASCSDEIWWWKNKSSKPLLPQLAFFKSHGFITAIEMLNKMSWYQEWGITMTELPMLFGEYWWWTLSLWTRKVIECWEFSEVFFSILAIRMSTAVQKTKVWHVKFQKWAKTILGQLC